MASPFAKYQSEQVQQIAPGFVEAYAQAGRSIGQGIASIGESVSKGMQIAEQKKKEELATKAALSPYIRNDQRVQVTEGLIKAGILTKAPDGTAVVSADYVGKVDMKALEKNLSFYNTTGGDGSKLSGDTLAEFTARYQAEQKYAADQAAKANTQIELDYKRAQIDELKSKAAERNANAGMYGAGIASMLGGEATPGFQIPDVTLPDTSTPGFQSLIGAPVSKAATAEPGVAAPATSAPAAAPAVSAALTAGTTATPTPAPAEPAAPAPTSADFDKYGYPKQKPMPAAPAAKAPAPAPAPAPAAPAAAPAPAPAAPAAAPAAAPSAPVTYDVPAESARVAEKMKAVEAKRAAVTTKYQNLRTQNEGRIAASNRNLAAGLPRNSVGFKLAEATMVLNEQRRKSIAEAEARELKNIDAEADFIKTEFTNYQASAEAARKGRAEQREITKEAVAATKAEEEYQASLSEKYPMIGVYTYRGYNLKDPKTGKRVNPAIAANVPPMSKEQFTEATEQNKGYGSAKNFLLNMNDVLEQRERGEGEYSYLERFRATAKDMENYFKAEQSSVFGVATFRKAIVSGGNFSDADREFVKQAITYLNTGALDMTNADLRSSLNALTFMLDGMYRVNLEELGMAYNKEAALEKAEQLRAGGDKVGAAAIERQVKTTDKFNKTFNLSQDSALSISKAKIAEERAKVQKGLNGFKFNPNAK